MGFCCRRWWL